MFTMTDEAFNEIYTSHQDWLATGSATGTRACFYNIIFDNFDFTKYPNLQHAKFESSMFKNVRFANTNFSETSFDNVTFLNITFTFCEFHASFMNACKIIDSSLGASNLQRMKQIKTFWQNVTFNRCSCKEQSLAEVKFKTCMFTSTPFDKSWLSNCSFTKDCAFITTLVYYDDEGTPSYVPMGTPHEEGASFYGATLLNTHFSNTTMKRADFGSVMLLGGYFRTCQIDNSDFTKARINETKFMHCNLSYATFDECQLADVGFSHVNLIESEFVDSTIMNVKLDDEVTKQSQTFYHCTLNQVNFKDVDMYGPYFIACQTEGVKFHKTTIAKALFKVIDANTISTDMKFTDCTIEASEFDELAFGRLCMTDCKINSSIFNTCVIANAEVKNTAFDKVTFTRSVFEEVDFTKSSFTNTEFNFVNARAIIGYDLTSFEDDGVHYILRFKEGEAGAYICIDKKQHRVNSNQKEDCTK